MIAEHPVRRVETGGRRPRRFSRLSCSNTIRSRTRERRLARAESGVIASNGVEARVKPGEALDHRAPVPGQARRDIRRRRSPDTSPRRRRRAASGKSGPSHIPVASAWPAALAAAIISAAKSSPLAGAKSFPERHSLKSHAPAGAAPSRNIPREIDPDPASAHRNHAPASPWTSNSRCASAAVGICAGKPGGNATSRSVSSSNPGLCPTSSTRRAAAGRVLTTSSSVPTVAS